MTTLDVVQTIVQTTVAITGLEIRNCYKYNLSAKNESARQRYCKEITFLI